MKALVLYESFFGNTEKVAGAVGEALGLLKGEGIVKVQDVKPDQLTGLEMLVVGSPTRAFRPTGGISAFLKGLPVGCLEGVKVAAFDTRIDTAEISSKLLKFLANRFGYAAEPIAAALEKKGGVSSVDPEGFFVKDSEGPLRDGELERAAEWAKRLTG